MSSGKWIETITERPRPMCECGRGRRIKKGRGCELCEAQTLRYIASRSESRARLAAATRAGLEAVRDLMRYAGTPNRHDAKTHHKLTFRQVTDWICETNKAQHE